MCGHRGGLRHILSQPSTDDPLQANQFACWLGPTRFRRYRWSFAESLLWELAFELLLCRVLSVCWWAVLHLPEGRDPMADRRPNSWVGFASAATVISISKCSPCGCGTGLMQCNEGLPSLSKDGIGHDRFSENSLFVGLLAL